MYVVNTHIETCDLYHISMFFPFTLVPLHPGTPGIPRGPVAPAWPGKPF
jgi:hypothetical protein